MKKLTLLIIGLLFILSSPTFAGIGKMIFDDCGDECAKKSWVHVQTNYIKSIETLGCVSGDCVQIELLDPEEDGSFGGTNCGEAIWETLGYTEITVEYYYRLSPGGRDITGANLKGFRIFAWLDAETVNTVFVSEEPHFSHDSFMYVMVATANDEIMTYNSSIITDVNQVAGYCTTDNGDGTFTCERTEFRFTMDGVDGMADNVWYKMRWYFRMPSYFGASDGEVKLWINDTWMFTGSNITFDRELAPWQFGYGMFFSSSEATCHVYQSYDEIRIWEGFVPPHTEPKRTRLDIGSGGNVTWASTGVSFGN